MADQTGIPGFDATWNLVRGCSRESAGCDNCFAVPVTHRLGRQSGLNGERYGGLVAGEKSNLAWTGKVRPAVADDEVWNMPHKWRASRRVLVGTTGDIFHPDLPPDFHQRLIMELTALTSFNRHLFFLLTKRPERALRVLQNVNPHKRFGRGVLIGASIENQEVAGPRLAALLELAELGWRTWVSYEPALGPVDWRANLSIEWLVSGPETGPRARPSDLAWHRATRDHCEVYCPYFYKGGELDGRLCRELLPLPGGR